jgi:hypothetical protein
MKPRPGRPNPGTKRSESLAVWSESIRLNARSRPPSQRRRPYRDFGAIPGVKLFHDVPHVNLHSALAHVQLIGDHLVGLALTDGLDHRQLASGDRALQCMFGLNRLSLPGLEQALRRNVSAACRDKSQGLDKNLKSRAHRDVTVRPLAQGGVSLVEIVRLGQDHRSHGRVQIHQQRKFDGRLLLGQRDVGQQYDRRPPVGVNLRQF